MIKKLKIVIFTISLISSNLFLAHSALSKEKDFKLVSKNTIAKNGFADIVEDLLPTVVNISATHKSRKIGTKKLNDDLFEELPQIPLFEQLKKQFENHLQDRKSKQRLSTIGSGFIISKDGYIVTNYHVIENTEEILASLHDGQKYKAKIVGIDKKTDLALLKISPKKDLKFATFGDSNKARIGDWTIVIGNPYGLGSSVTTGILSARGRNITNGKNDDFLQTDAAINKGNSGGPIFDINGQVIGISTAIFSPSGGNVGIGFATPSSSAKKIIKDLKEHGEVVRGWIGVSVQNVSKELARSMNMRMAKGAFIVEVEKDGPADKAGILQTDIIIQIDDQDIMEMQQLPKIISSYEIGKKAKIKILRQGEIEIIKVKIDKMKNSEDREENIAISKEQKIKSQATEILGLSLAELSAKVRKNNFRSTVEGLMIVDIKKDSEASKKGILIGDVIISANQTKVKSVKDLKKIIKKLPKKNNLIFLFIKRGDDNYAVVLKLKN